ncbi:MAG: TetR/AcrR family transcriptional regulator [Sphingopyxis sp.]|uniref:TetR/AcrR family transcriptional regulator n=1 Tax=Sphingopyxis sp. TaxID=1908224 RepID=UPI002ABA168A|nr:TetR/AcrR family transcriptional regulator [Sphingopyxis sp.]MDZ3832667.1 TetR/AcrR family transcriptional regulator [Sphingopyxis sp.]
MTLPPLPPQPDIAGLAPAAGKRGPKPKISAESWFIAALEQLAIGGVESVRIDLLAERMGVTKGTFYARFDNREIFLDALVEYWRQRTSIGLVAELGAMDGSPGDRLLRLFTISQTDRARTGAWVEIAMRTWALTDPRPAAALAEIDRHRLTYFESVLRANGFAQDQARARAFLIYTFVIGDTVLSGDRATMRDMCSAILSAP